MTGTEGVQPSSLAGRRLPRQIAVERQLLEDQNYVVDSLLPIKLSKTGHSWSVVAGHCGGVADAGRPKVGCHFFKLSPQDCTSDMNRCAARQLLRPTRTLKNQMPYLCGAFERGVGLAQSGHWIGNRRAYCSCFQHLLGHHIGGDGRQRPPQMAVPGVVEHVGVTTSAYAGHHVGQHGAQAGPGHHLAGVDAREALVHPSGQWTNAVGANVAVGAIELGGAGRSPNWGGPSPWTRCWPTRWRPPR